MNEPYMGNTQFTVAELMSYNLSENAELVHNVYLSAIAEYDLEQLMARIKSLWQDKNFKIAKHIPDSMFVKGVFFIKIKILKMWSIDILISKK